MFYSSNMSFTSRRKITIAIGKFTSAFYPSEKDVLLSSVNPSLYSRITRFINLRDEIKIGNKCRLENNGHIESVEKLSWK